MKQSKLFLLISVATFICFSASFMITHLFLPGDDRGPFVQRLVMPYADQLSFTEGVDQMIKTWELHELQELHKLKLSSISSHVVIELVDSDQLQLELTGIGITNEQLQWGISNGELRFQLADGHQWSFMRMFFSSGMGSINRATIKLPRQWAPALEISTISGNITGTDLQGEQINFHSISGALNLKSNARDHNLKTISGNINLELKHSAVFLEMGTTSGRLRISVDEPQLNAEISFSTISGRLRVDKPNAQTGPKQTYGAGTGQWSLKTVSGNATITPRT